MTQLAKGVKYCAIYIILLSILTTLCYCCPDGYHGTPCQLRSCEPLLAPQNGAIVTCNRTYLSPCVMRCDEGYEPHGSMERQCIIGSSDNMIWTGLTLSCKDFSPPSLTCPFRVVVTNDKGKATAVVNWSVHASDNSVDVDPHAVIKVQSSHQPLDVFPIGSHIVTVTATDEAGNTADCTFFIEVIDNEPPVITSCPSDIVLKDLVADQERVNWYRPYATDNSGYPPKISSNRQIGDLFAVPGSYEIVYEAEDWSGNTATCSFRITLEKKICHMYPPPHNGALACYDIGNSDQACAVLCKESFHFTTEPPLRYICLSGVWQFVGFSLVPSYTIPWPNCSAQAPPTGIESSSRYFSFSGDANDPSVIENIKDKFISFTQIFPLCPGGCQKDSVQVFAGQASS